MRFRRRLPTDATPAASTLNPKAVGSIPTRPIARKSPADFRRVAPIGGRLSADAGQAGIGGDVPLPQAVLRHPAGNAPDRQATFLRESVRLAVTPCELP